MRRLFCFKHLIRGVIGLVLCVGLVLLALAVPAPEPRGPQDPADLLPSSTLLYLEFTQPQPTVQELRALLKGSALEDMPTFLAQFRERLGDDIIPFGLSESFSMLGTFLGPEGLTEAGRIKAGCVAVTGFDKKQGPEHLGVLLTGDSTLPGFAMRAILTSNRNIRSVEKVSGVTLFREIDWRRRFTDLFDKDKPVDRSPEEKADPDSNYTGPTYALMPGMLLVGSNRVAVRNAVLRARGIKAEQSLSQSTAFQRTARLRQRPGVFAYADLDRLAVQAEKILQDDPQQVPRFGPVWKGIKVLANPKGLRTFAASLTLQKSGLDLQAQLLFDPNQDIPLLALLPDKAAPTELLHFASSNALAALTWSGTDGEKRWEKLLVLADALFRETGGMGKAPSKEIEGVEDQLKLRFGKDVFGKLAGISLVVSMPAEKRPEGKLPVPGTEPLPLLILKTANVEAAKSLESALLELIRLLDADKTLLPTTHEMQAQRIHSFPRTAVRPALHQGRHGPTLVIGLNANQVAEGLVAGMKQQGLLAQPHLAERLKEQESHQLVGVASLNRTLLALMAWQPSRPPGDNQPDFLTKQNREVMDNLVQLLAQSTKEIPPAVLSVARQPGVLTLSMHQHGLQAVSPQTVDALLEWNLRANTGATMPFKDAKAKDDPFPKDIKDKDKPARIFKDAPKDAPALKDKP